MTEKTKNDEIYEIPISNKDNDENEELMSSDENTPKQNSGEEQQLSEEERVPEERDYINMIQRLKAEFENYKRRVRKEREELSDFVKRELIEKLLPVLDDFERMLDNAHKI
ncbi:nucleotide exchange factor GrpE, partial [candidate division KSB1 bacterium]|nr:nucleotide exchange factor GrpE [candidate division KSB1 bacterium]